MKQCLGLVTSIFILFGCGVEAGNPGTAKPDTKKGGVAIRFATQFDASSPTLSLNLSSFNLNRGDAEVTRIVPKVNAINLFSNDSNDEFLVAESNDIPTGSYNNIIVQLSSEQPIFYRDREGQDRAVDIDENSAAMIQIDENFEVSDSEKTEIVLNIDPYRSLVNDESDKKRFKFRPQGHSHRRGRGLRYDGQANISGAAWVCAYAFEVKKLDLNRLTSTSSEQDKKKVDKRAKMLADRKIFDRREDVIKDDVSLCSNAFAVAPVVDGEYHLRHLIPATYLLRFFKVDGSYEDASDPIKLRPWKKNEDTGARRHRS